MNEIPKAVMDKATKAAEELDKLRLEIITKEYFNRKKAYKGRTPWNRKKEIGKIIDDMQAGQLGKR